MMIGSERETKRMERKVGEREIKKVMRRKMKEEKKGERKVGESGRKKGSR